MNVLETVFRRFYAVDSQYHKRLDNYARFYTDVTDKGIHQNHIP